MRYIMFKTQAAVIGFKAQGDSRVTDQSQHDVMTSRYIPVTRNNFVLRHLQLLHFPRELARQITLIDHELFKTITTADILRRVSEGSSKRRKKDEEVWETSTVKMFSDRFNQLSSWVVASLLKEDSDQNTADMVVQFIETAKVGITIINRSIHGLEARQTSKGLTIKLRFNLETCGPSRDASQPIRTRDSTGSSLCHIIIPLNMLCCPYSWRYQILFFLVSSNVSNYETTML